MNAAAGHACLSLQIRGPLSTLATGCVSGLAGLGYAADLVRTGEADVMLAVSADELTDLLHFGYDRLGLLAGGRGAPVRPGRFGLCAGRGRRRRRGGVARARARARGATILAELVGHSVTADAFRVAGNAPDGIGLGRELPAGARRRRPDARRRGDGLRRRPRHRGARPGRGPGDRPGVAARRRPADQHRRPGRAPALHHVDAVAGLRAPRRVATGWVPEIAGLRDPIARGGRIPRAGRPATAPAWSPRPTGAGPTPRPC